MCPAGPVCIIAAAPAWKYVQHCAEETRGRRWRRFALPAVGARDQGNRRLFFVAVGTDTRYPTSTTSYANLSEGKCDDNARTQSRLLPSPEWKRCVCGVCGGEEKTEEEKRGIYGACQNCDRGGNGDDDKGREIQSPPTPSPPPIATPCTSPS